MPPLFAGTPFTDLWHPGIIAATLALAAAYLGAVGPWRGRWGAGAPPAGRGQVLSFLLGLLVFYTAAGSPLDHLGDRLLMSAHMLQHMLLAFAMPPLLLLGTPEWLLRPALRLRLVRRLLERLTRPLTALVAFNLVFSAMHLPVVFDYTLAHDGAHFLEHALLVTTALMLWWPILAPLPEMRLPDPVQMAYLFAIEVFQTLAFALITFAPHLLYAGYGPGPRPFGLTPLQDQELGGLLMKLGAMVTLGPALWVTFFRWARREGAARTDFTAPLPAAPRPEPVPLPGTLGAD